MGMLLFAGGVAVVVGVLIGAIGIGGVLLVPMLTYVLGISIHVAIALVQKAFGQVRLDSLFWAA